VSYQLDHAPAGGQNIINLKSKFAAAGSKKLASGAIRRRI
jgi:hypothetical protein